MFLAFAFSLNRETCCSFTERILSIGTEYGFPFSIKMQIAVHDGPPLIYFQSSLNTLEKINTAGYLSTQMDEVIKRLIGKNS